MWQAVRKVLFWTYSRGSWQYDVIVLVILAFIFLTPTALFDGSLLGRNVVRPAEKQASEGLPLTAKPSTAVDEKKTAAESAVEKDPPGR